MAEEDKDKKVIEGEHQTQPREVPVDLTANEAAEALVGALGSEIGELSPEELEKRVIDELRKSQILVIEDDPTFLDQIVGRLKEKLGETDNLHVAEDFDSVERKVQEISQSWQGGETLCVISDLQIPRRNGSIPDERFGQFSIGLVAETIQNWNNHHPDKLPVVARVILNSAMDQEVIEQMGLKVDAKNLGAERGNKENGVDTLMDLVKKDISGK